MSNLLDSVYGFVISLAIYLYEVVVTMGNGNVLIKMLILILLRVLKSDYILYYYFNYTLRRYIGCEFNGHIYSLFGSLSDEIQKIQIDDNQNA